MSKLSGVGLFPQEMDSHPNNWQHPSLILMEPVPCWKASNIWCIHKLGHQMSNLDSLNWVTSVCFQGVKSMCWEYSFVLQTMLSAMSQIVHINPHPSGTLERQDLNTVLSFISLICYEIMAPPDTLLFLISNGTGTPSFTKRLADWIKTRPCRKTRLCVCVLWNMSR